MTVKAWERQTDESAKAHEAFSLYLFAGVNRTHDSVAQALGKSTTLIHRWASQYGWAERVRAFDEFVDSEARKKIERQSISRKAELLKRHANMGRVMQGKGLEYLQAHGVDKSSDALIAMSKGIEIERKAESLPDWVFEIVAADDDQLTREYNRLLTTIGSNPGGDETAGDRSTGQDSTDNSPSDQ